MDPITAITGASQLVGLGMSLFGASKSSSASSNIASASQQQFALESQVNDQRKAAMELSARRQSTEIFRNAQKARSMALVNATSQGAQGGSGIQGGYGQISGESNFNLAGVQQNLQIGQNIFGLDNQINQQKSAIAGFQADQASGQGISSLGGSLMKASGTLGSLGGNFFGGSKLGSSTGGYGVTGGNTSAGYIG